MDKPNILDQQGKAQDWNWLSAAFGKVSLQKPQVDGSTGVFRLVGLQDAEGPAVLVVKVLGKDGKPLPGAQVVRYWANTPELPAWPQPGSRWRDRGMYGPTDKNGNLGFGMDKGDVYAPPDSGPACVWIADPAGPSELVEGLGMLAQNHRHLDLVFSLQEATNPPAPSPEPPAPPEPTPVPSGLILTDEQWKLLLNKLDLILAAVEKKG